MSTMTRVQAEALAAFISRMRTDWRQAGVVAALEKASTNADAWDVARACLTLAAEPSVQTPGLLPGPGPHWRRPDGEMTPRRGDHNVRCPTHSLSFMPCPQCTADSVPPTDDYLAAKAALPKRAPSPQQRHLADIERDRAAQEAS